MNSQETIQIVGARSNNLKDVSCDIMRGALTVITGVSGSGKSTLAFETLYAEGQRRYMESLSTYARQFLQKMPRPDVDAIHNVPPAIAIEQKNKVKNARSTVGTVTEIYDYLRLLFAKIGQPFCIDCHLPLNRDTPASAQKYLLEKFSGETAIVFFEYSSGEGALRKEDLLRDGFRRLLMTDKRKREFTVASLEDDELKDQIYGVIVDRIVLDANDVRKRGRLLESLEMAFVKGTSGLGVFFPDKKGSDRFVNFHPERRCKSCGKIFNDISPVQFSFNNPQGACPTCEGFGRTSGVDLNRVIPDENKTLKGGAIDPFMKPAYRPSYEDLLKACKRLKIPTHVPWKDLTAPDKKLVIEGGKAAQKRDTWYGINGFFTWLESKRYKTHVRIFSARYRGFTTCPDCHGERLKKESLNVFIAEKTINQLCQLPVSELFEWFQGLDLEPEEAGIAGIILKEVMNRLQFLKDVGLGYLTLARQARTLSGGESQRIALASALGTALTETLYVLDEPSIGLHPRDHQRLLKVIFSLRNLGNTIVVVEHDPIIIANADQVIDLGPKAGRGGGEVVFAGTYPELLRSTRSVTGQILNTGGISAEKPNTRRKPHKWVEIKKARVHNLQSLDVKIPLEVLCCVTGVSGAGKSSLFYNILYAAYQKMTGQALDFELGDFSELNGFEQFSKMVLMDQSGLGKSLRSNTATYIDIYSAIRKLLADTKAARSSGFTPGSFSFNVSGGRCEVCEGAGVIVLDMQFLEEVHIPCENCGGLRFKPEILAVQYRGKNIIDILGLTVLEAGEFFADQTDIFNKLQVLKNVGLDYLTLGQATSSLSGGEAQRLKLALHMTEGGHGKTLFLFDEPTTGLHPSDIAKLLQCYEALLARGDTVWVIEHNLDLIYQADYVIDLGPEGGDQGGRLVAKGTPEEILAEPLSYTGRYLEEYLTHLHGKKSRDIS